MTRMNQKDDQANMRMNQTDDAKMRMSKADSVTHDAAKNEATASVHKEDDDVRKRMTPREIELAKRYEAKLLSGSEESIPRTIYETLFPNLSKIPIGWLILGLIAIVVNVFSMFII